MNYGVLPDKIHQSATWSVPLALLGCVGRNYPWYKYHGYKMVHAYGICISAMIAHIESY